eukprot:3215084-Prorocentrum_lima.AAC.1
MTSSLVGSEMCIRDRIKTVVAKYQSTGLETMFDNTLQRSLMTDQSEPFACLLYTSDAADDM